MVKIVIRHYFFGIDDELLNFNDNRTYNNIITSKLCI